MNKFREIFKTFLNYDSFINYDYVFFIENRFYDMIFFDLAKNLKNSNKKILILCSNIESLNFYKNSNFNALYIGSFFSFFFINNIKCNIFLTSTPDLGRNYKKSKNCKKYIYIFHSLASVHQFYRQNAFINFDEILCCGDYQVLELKKEEEIYNLPKKKLINTGYLFLDYLKKNISYDKLENNTILIATSWNYNKNNFYEIYLKKLIKSLLNENLKVILRPHPENYKRNYITTKDIINSFKDEKNFILDKNNNPADSISKAKCLITDNSTIAIEYKLLLNREVIYFKSAKKIHNKNYSKISESTLEEVFKKELCKEIDEVNCNIIFSIIENYDCEINSIKIENFISKYFQNFENSLELTTNYLLKMR